MIPKITSLEQLRAVDTGNYHPIFFNSCGDEFCEHGCAEKAFLEHPGEPMYVDHSGNEADNPDGVQCCDCGRWIVEPRKEA